VKSDLILTGLKFLTGFFFKICSQPRPQGLFAAFFIQNYKKAEKGPGNEVGYTPEIAISSKEFYPERVNIALPLLVYYLMAFCLFCYAQLGTRLLKS